MIYDRLRTLDFVQWNPAVLENLGDMPYNFLWEEEPIDCILQVINKVDYAENSSIELACTKECGCHSFLEISREDYEAYSEAIGDEALNFVHTYEDMAAMFVPEVEEYNIEQDTNYIYQLITSGNLPSRSKRKAG